MSPALPFVALALFLLAFAAGWLLCQAYFSRVARRAGREAAYQQRQLRLQRQRSRARLQALREVLRRQRATEASLREALQAAEVAVAAERARAGDVEVQVAVAHARLAETEARASARERDVEGLRQRHESVARELQESRERMSANEFASGLLRIERDELAARTQRLAALSLRTPAEPGPAPQEDLRAEAGALREAAAGKDARIHELECRLRETQARADDVAGQLRTWKHRMAPLVLQLRVQRERNRRLRALVYGADAAGPVPSAAGHAPRHGDDLKRIRGIGPVIERKLHAQGIHEYRQIAELDADGLAGIAARLELPPSRPARDRWIEQARALYEAQRAPVSTFG